MKKISVLGAGESGIGAALLAKRRGYQVFVSDSGVIPDQRKAALKAMDIDFEEGQHTVEKIVAGEEVIKSPGIPGSSAVVKQLLEAGKAVIDELEFASRYSLGKVIAITGTNGKTTTALLTHHLLKKAGVDVGLAGNVGQSWAGQLAEQDHDWWVLEVSSFQIDGFRMFKPDVAVIINITPDHLDRYGHKMENYIQSKLKLLKNMDDRGHLVYYKEDSNIRLGLEKLWLMPSVHQVSLSTATTNGSWIDQSQMVISFGNKDFSLAKEEVALTGDHNMINVMCSVNAALAAGADTESIKSGLKDFRNASHRMEKVEEINGVSYINDSKGTNVDATVYALAAFKSPLIWIAGGVDKGNDYSQLDPWVKDQVKLLICLGKDNEKLKQAFKGMVPEIKETQSMVEAVSMAFGKGETEDVVLLSPACASFDLFRNYEDRGDQFKEAVRQLKKKKR